jgi:hypothetical protein
LDLGFVVQEVQSTPNPNALKFVLDRPISDQPTSYFNPDSAKSNPLATQLFAVPGVVSLLFLGDFVTINKSAEARWADIKKTVEKILSSA